MTSEEPATGQAVRLLMRYNDINFFATQSTSFMSEPKKTLPPEVIFVEKLPILIANYYKVEEKRITFVNNQTTMALDVLVWLCDGQQKIMQDALRTPSTFSVICNNVYTISVYITITGF